MYFNENLKNFKKVVGSWDMYVFKQKIMENRYWSFTKFPYNIHIIYIYIHILIVRFGSYVCSSVTINVSSRGQKNYKMINSILYHPSININKIDIIIHNYYKGGFNNLGHDGGLYWSFQWYIMPNSFLAIFPCIKCSYKFSKQFIFGFLLPTKCLMIVVFSWYYLEGLSKETILRIPSKAFNFNFPSKTLR